MFRCEMERSVQRQGALTGLTWTCDVFLQLSSFLIKIKFATVD